MHSACVPGPAPMAIGRAVSPSPLRPGPALDTLEPPPSTALLAAEEAKERLREIVEGFFSRRLRTNDGKRVERQLVRSPPGLGKTREAVEWAIAYRTEQAGKDGTRLSVGDFNQAVVPAQTSTRAKSSPQALCAPGVPSGNGG
jgi:hypothetical protein